MWRREPELRNARWNHSCCSLGNHTFIFAGKRDWTIYERSVESYEVGTDQWKVIVQRSNLFFRLLPAVAVLSQCLIACFSGQAGTEVLSDGFVLDLRDNSFMKILGAENDLKFHCFSEVQQTGSQHFITLGQDSAMNLHLVSLSQDGSYFETRSVINYGQ